MSDDEYGFSPMERMRQERDAAIAERDRLRERVTEADHALDHVTAERDRLRRELEALRDTMREDAAKIERIFATPDDQRAYAVKARVTEILRYARRLDAILRGES